MEKPSGSSGRSLGIFLLPLDRMLVHRRVTPSIEFAGAHLHTWVERGSVRVKCLVQEHKQCPRPGLESGQLDLYDKM